MLGFCRGGSGIRTHGGITSTVFKTVRGVSRKSATSWGICRKSLWHNGFRLLIIVGHLPVVCILFRSPAPPARPEMRKTAHRAYAPASVAEGSEDVLHEQDEMEAVGR